MHKIAIRLLFAASISSLALAGCYLPSPYGWSTGPGKSGVFVSTPSPYCIKNLQVPQSPRSQVTPEGLLQAQVDIYNAGAYDMSISYQFSWFDKDGVAIHPDSRAWQPLTLGGTKQATLTAVCTYPGAAQFRVDIEERR